MKKILSLIVLLQMITVLAFAQMVDPVKWSHKVQANGQELVVSFTANIDRGFHLYSMDIPDGGPQKTEFTYEKLTGAKTAGPVKVTNGKLIKKHDEAFDMDLAYWENTVTFEQKFKLTGSAYTIEGYVYFMSCNDGMCTPPTRYEFEIKGESKADAPAASEDAPAATEAPAATDTADDNGGASTEAAATSHPDDLTTSQPPNHPATTGLPSSISSTASVLQRVTARARHTRGGISSSQASWQASWH